MSKRIIYSLALASLTLSDLSVVALEPQIEQAQELTVGEIKVVVEDASPLTTIDTQGILNKLKTKQGVHFSQQIFDSDLKELADQYDRVEPRVQIRDGTVTITLKIWPKPVIGSINFTGNERFKSSKLKSELDIAADSIFVREEFNKAFNNLKEFYIKRGYYESELSYTLKPKPNSSEVDIEITVKEGQAGIIDKITFEGLNNTEKGDLLSMIYTKKYSLFTSWMTGAGTYREEALEQDRLTIIEYFQNKGYADTKVEIKTVDVPGKDRVNIVVTVEKGEIYNLGKVSFGGNTIFDDEEVEKHLLISSDGVYSPKQIRETAESIKSLYGRKGYIDSNVQYETNLKEDEPLYDVHFTITEGQQFHVGLIHICGNITTRSNVILHESFLVPGEVFDSARLEATQARLENTGYFKCVNVYAVRSEDSELLGDNYRDVYIEVEETMTGNLAASFGISSADSVFGGFDVEENNFCINGLTRLWSHGACALRGGGEHARASIKIGDRIYTYSVGWMTPYFRDTLWRVGSDVSYTRSRLQSKYYRIDNLGLSLYASHPINTYWAFGWRYRAQNSWINLTNKGKRAVRKCTDPTISQEERDKACATKTDLEKIESDDGFLSGLGFYLSHDSTDSLMYPRCGWRNHLEAEFVGLGGEITFMKYSSTNTYYWSFWRRGTFKARVEGRYINPIWKTPHSADIPASERLFLGGENSVRGYKPFGLGPRIGSTNSPLGGTSSTLTSLEYNHCILPILDVFTFIDGGGVQDKRFRFGHYRWSVGAGARIRLGNRLPIMVGYGYPINPKDNAQERRVFFSMGGQF